MLKGGLSHVIFRFLVLFFSFFQGTCLEIKKQEHKLQYRMGDHEKSKASRTKS